VTWDGQGGGGGGYSGGGAMNLTSSGCFGGTGGLGFAAPSVSGAQLHQGGTTTATYFNPGDAGDGNRGGAGEGGLASATGTSGRIVVRLATSPVTIEASGVSRRWSDGTYAVACWQYRDPPSGYSYSGATGDGRYTIKPGALAFDVYCDMTTDGGGYTLVDNDASASAAFTSRQAGANPDPSVTRGSYLPAYQWSTTSPRLLCKSNVFNGTLNWLTLIPTAGTAAREYPTATTTGTGYAWTTGHWSVGTLNGNTNNGTGSWIYSGDDRFGSVYIGSGAAPTCACNYHASSITGLGYRVDGLSPTCSTWVR
jgi:hypothetical protein